jgi:hypothetical protein
MVNSMNWTSTQVPLWQIDCDEFRKVGRPFELRDVVSAEHEQFVAVFSVRFGWAIKREGSVVVFSPPATA